MKDKVSIPSIPISTLFGKFGHKIEIKLKRNKTIKIKCIIFYINKNESSNTESFEMK